MSRRRIAATAIGLAFCDDDIFGGHAVGQFRGVGKSAVTTAGDDGLEGADEREEQRGARIGGQFFEERCSDGLIASEEGLSHGEADASIGIVVLASVTAVGPVASDGLALRHLGGVEFAGGRLDVGEDGP